MSREPLCCRLFRSAVARRGSVRLFVTSVRRLLTLPDPTGRPRWSPGGTATQHRENIGTTAETTAHAETSVPPLCRAGAGVGTGGQRELTSRAVRHRQKNSSIPPGLH